MTQSAFHSEINARAHLFAVAGLLHDAGKVFQPAQVDLPSPIERLTPMLCPTHYKTQQPTHQHVLYTAYFLDRARTNFGGLDPQQIFRVACYHHRPSGDAFDEHVLTKADWIASGHDRRPAEEAGGRVTGLLPVLSTLQWPVGGLSESESQIPTSRLAFAEHRFLPDNPQTIEEYRQSCQIIGEQLIAGLQMDFPDPRSCVESLLGLTERFFHAIPASRDRNQSPDVNLFDHSRIVAAFAACLGIQHETGPCDARAIEGRFRLVSIGLGGIQRFLLRTIPPLDAGPGVTGDKGMGRRLRARSFYISLLSRMISQRILDATGMPSVNLLIDAGGRSLLLLPDVEPILKRLDETVASIRRWVASEIGGVIRLDIAVSDSLSDSAFQEDEFTSTFRGTDHSLAQSRLRLPVPELQTPDGWAESPWIGESVSLPIDRKEFNGQLEQLGQWLPKVGYIALDGMSRGSGPALDVLGYRVSLHPNPPGGDRHFAMRVTGRGEATTPLFVTANHVPTATAFNRKRLANIVAVETEREAPPQDGELLTFVDLAHLATDEEGHAIETPMLGALKADVDRLGMLLGYGLGTKVSFGRYASMARSLDLFFKGFLSEQLQQRFPHIYTVFAGGDDLFLIGPWFDIIRFLADLGTWFQRMSGGNPNITFSAGVIFSHPKVPVRQLAVAAGDALEASKESGRDRVTIGPVTLPWPDFHRSLEFHRAIRALAGGESPTLKCSMIYRFLQYGRMAMKTEDCRTLSDMKWRAQLSYDIKRNLPDPVRGTDELRRLHEMLLQVRTAEDARVLYTAATLSLYHMRRN